MQYQWIFFDADETLFRFDSFAGLRNMMGRFGIEFSKQDFDTYQEINLPLWKAYQDGQIDADKIKTARFASLSLSTGKSELELNRLFLESMAEICTPLPGAKNLMKKLSKDAKLAIITNGFVDLQHVRLEKTGLEAIFDFLVISEEEGVAKPDSAIFNTAWVKAGRPDKSKVLMVGDNPDSDILGAHRFGFDTCWLNESAKSNPLDFKPTYTISKLSQLETLLLN